jgi:aqualysin 1
MPTFSIARLAASCFLAVVAAVGASAASAQPADPPATHAFRSRPIAGRYIVVMKRDVANPDSQADAIVREAGGRGHHLYSRALNGFAATFSDGAAERVRHHPSVEFVEQDQTVSVTVSGAESLASWGLDRVDQVDKPLDTFYHYNATGRGVAAFIIDTGINSTHADFTGRILGGFTTVADGNGTEDCMGHGTHVSGTLGGTTWGVAKQVWLVPVRVLDCTGSGTMSDVIAGLDYVARSLVRPAVANLSLAGGMSTALNAAVAGAVAHGVTVMVAAGNNTDDACKYSPASEASAITVGATTSSDAQASYSNFGTCVDIYAPGSAITSDWIASPTMTHTISGTSMATPHVTGAAALVLEASPDASPQSVAAFLKANATANRLTGLGAGSPNLLLYTLATATAPPPIAAHVAVKTLTGSATGNAIRWRAHAAVAVRDIATSAPVANATVHGRFSPGGSTSCVTNTSGGCTLTSSAITRSTALSTLNVTGISGTNLAYDPSQNLAAQIIISRP